MTTTNYLINWIGGKSRLRKTISEHIPSDIKSYIEVFGGGAWVLFYREKWANHEVYNDLDGNLYNLFTVVKYHADAFTEEYRYMLNSRRLFDVMHDFKPITDIQKAAQFFFLLQNSYGALMENFAYGKTRTGKSVNNILERVKAASNRLDKVYIENHDFEDVIKRYDNESAFFYIDPPYKNYENNLYKVVKSEDFEHERLFHCIKNIKGRWLLSYNNNEYIRNLYKDYKIIEVERISKLSLKDKIYKEVLIKNY